MPDLIENERTKLLANALDRASTAVFTIGVFAPTTAAIYSLGVPPLGIGYSVLVILIWLFAAIGLHLAARFILRGLEQ